MLSMKLSIPALLVLMLITGGMQAGGNPAKGQELAVDCSDCHGEDGKGDEDNPSIAGLDEAEHIKMLKGYKSGEIEDEDEMMLEWVEELSDQDFADLAAYYATLDG